ncbi:MAG: CBS domain-containing protein [Methanomethylovorans sp.]|jgi:Zn-dependent protease/predicted transcriptional regulator|nr:CBS domain-containing protein [Methanomethylovorans sp.]
MNTSFQIGTILGIPIKLHITFLLILPVFALVFATNPAPFGFQDQSSPLINYLLSFTTTIFLFLCVLLHELGHSYIAQRYGVEIKDITLMLIGGVSSMEEIPRNPSQELKIAFAGPLVSLVIGFTLFIVNFLIASLIVSYASTSIYLMFNILGSINIVLGLFNLLPAFPMDGGRLLRAWYAKRMNYIQATHYAASVGKIFAFIMGVFGLFYNPWLILIAFFVYIGASEEDKATTVTVTLEKYLVSDVMTRDVISVSPYMSIENLLQFMLEHKHMGYPVMEGDSLKGIVTLTDVHKVPPLERAVLQVRDIMTTDVISLPVNAKASEAFKLMVSNNIGRLLVVDSTGSVVGILSRTDLMRAMMFYNEQL